MATERGPRSKTGGQGPQLQKLNLAHVSTRRRHMLGEELVIEWDSYTAESSALAAKLIKNVSVESGGSENPQIFNTHTVAEFPGDVILLASNEPDESSITTRWVSETKVRLYLERLLKVRPLKTPRGFRAHIPVSTYVLNEIVGVRLHLSEPRFAEIGTGAVAKAGSSSSGGEKASSADKQKERKDQKQPEQGEKAGD
ncbi:MAG: hypothetical protein ACOY94_10705 [Bacillota bacterium]